MKKYNYRTDRPQDEIPEDIWIQNVLEAYHKEHEELEFLRSFAHGLEEENVLLKKELDKFVEKETENSNVFARNKSLSDELKRHIQLIEKTYPLRVMKLSSYKKIIQRQNTYISQMERLLDANGIEYHKIAQQPIIDADNIDVNAVRKPDDLKKANELTYETDNTIDGRSKKKAYTIIDSGLLDSMEPGTVKCLQQIHAYLFGGLYDFAGQIRTKTIWKDGTLFCRAEYLMKNLSLIEAMPERTFDEIVNKYVEMNVAHPFMEGNGRSTRIWLDLIFKKRLGLCVDWSKIDKKSYLEAMRRSTTDARTIKSLFQGAMTDKINDRELFMKGIDYSYYYEQEE